MEWFDEEYANVNKEENAARERAIHIKTRGAKIAYQLARTKERRLFRKLVRQLDEQALIEILYFNKYLYSFNFLVVLQIHFLWF
jgi:hypothetical protein